MSVLTLLGRARMGGAALALAFVYTGPPGPANAPWGTAAAAELATGEMSKLAVHAEPKPRMEAAFTGPDGETTLADFEGRVVLLNFWATWCAPCRKEMPAIDRLAAAMAGEDFAVVALSTDFGGTERPIRFLDEIGVEHLALYHDPRKAMAQEAAILGLPVTVLLDRQGREVARLVGDAEWDTPEAKAVIRRLIDTGTLGEG